MCGIVGFVNYKQDVSRFRNILINMNNTLVRRGPDEDGYYIRKHIALAHKRLIVIDPEGGKQPMVESCSKSIPLQKENSDMVINYNSNFVISYNGQIYNTKELRKTLTENGFTFYGHCDTEILLKSYIHYGKDVVNHLNGIFSFAIWNTKTQELFMARDHFGVKPLFYTEFDGGLIFASELKAIFKYPHFEKIIDSQGISELFGIGPSHTPGFTVYKDIFEIKPAHFAVYNKSGLHIEQYWKLESKNHLEDFDETCNHLDSLLKDAISRQLVSDMPICTFLSGGLDSSIITKFTSDYMQEQDMAPLDTYSVDYVDNDKNFVKSDFQPNSDNYYIDLMNKTTYSKHHTVMLDTPELASSLKEAMLARDMPGMADVDSSLYLFCKEVKKEKTVTLMGECADEIFGGYPWFFREDSLNSGTFPWSIAIQERTKLLNPSISSKINLKDYIDFRYNQSLSNVEILDTDSFDTAEKRKISYLTITWFMQTLLERADRMSMANGFEVRVPFCDYRLAQYMYNVPWEMKAYKGREKGLLRHIMKGVLPDEIVDRKKSPYPKTFNPTYLAVVKEMLTNIMKDSSRPINYLLNRDFILDILNTDGKAFSRPWFGQLMTGPQLMAYLCQVDMWLEEYAPRIEL